MKTTLLFCLLLIADITFAQTRNYKYDLYVDLHSIKAVKVDEGLGGDNDEDIHGELGIYSITGIPNNLYEQTQFPILIFKQSETSPLYVSTEYIPFNKEPFKIADLTFSQLTQLSLVIGGHLWDKENIISDPWYRTINQSPQDLRTICFDDPENRNERSQIQNMKPIPPEEPQLQIIQGGRDDYWQMDYYEYGDSRKSHIRVRWQFSVVIKELETTTEPNSSNNPVLMKNQPNETIKKKEIQNQDIKNNKKTELNKKGK